MTPEMSEVGAAQTQRVSASAGRGLVAAFTAASFMGAFLLFLVEPMVAKTLLPSLGGSPAVWNTAMVFFQATLLLGYAIAHLTLRRLSLRTHAVLQIVLLLAVLATLPVALPAGWQPPVDVAPAMWTILALVVMVGAPFAMLATVGPTLQRWFSFTTHPRADDPYFLYAAGNAGSLLALLAYPFALERALPLPTQSRLWTALYVLFVATIATSALCMLRLPRRDAPTATARPIAPVIPWMRQARWVFFAFVPSALLLGVTRYLSSDIAAVPLLWIVPLSLYLITFIVAFGRSPEQVVLRSARVLRVLAIPLALTFIGIVPDLRIQLPLQLGAFSVAALVAHGRLAVDRPDVGNLTRFFLLIAFGGALGGIFAALIAPVVFTTIMEYPIAIVLALAILPTTEAVRPFARRAHSLMLPGAAVVVAIVVIAVRSDGSQRSLTLAMLVAAAGLVAAYALARKPFEFAGAVGAIMILSLLIPANATLFADRTFFGISRVYADASGRHVLVSGTTVHGIENEVDGSLDPTPSAYYSHDGPAGDIFRRSTNTGAWRVAVIGAGAGSLASYLRPGDTMTFFEIDRAVERIATDPSLFSYVHDAAGPVDFVLGDGRLEIARSEGGYDLVAVDAFSGDAIPTHLLTREAVDTYLARTSAVGLVAFNVSNRYFDLAPVLGRIAHAEGLAAIVRSDPASTAAQEAEGALPSTWVVVAREPQDLAAIASVPGWTPLLADPGASLWTDDHTDLLATFVPPWR
jgi:hypothetical protein